MSEKNKPARATAVIFSTLNPQTNSYVTVGKVVFLATKIKDNLTLIAINNGKPFFAIPLTEQIHWEIQNEVYCTYVDPNQRSFLFQFPNVDEARAFSAIALSKKLSKESNFVCLTQGTGGIVDPKSPFNVNYKAYDCVMSTISEPVREDDNFQIFPNTDSPFKVLAGNPAGSVFAVSYAPGVVAIAQIVDPFASSAPLPNTTQSAQTSEQSTPQKKKKKSKHHDKPQKEEQKEEPKIEETKFDELLDQIKAEMSELFKRTESEVAAIHSVDLISSAIPPSPDTLIASLQRLQRRNMSTKAILDERQFLVSSLRSKEIDTTELDKIRRQIGEHTTELSARKNDNAALVKKIADARSQIEEANTRLVQAQLDSEVAEKISESNSSLEKMELESKLGDVKWNLENEKDDMANAAKEYESALTEAKRINEEQENNYADQLESMKKQVEMAKSKMKSEFVEAVISAVNGGMKDDQSYKVETILKILKNAMINQFENQFNVDFIEGGDYSDDEEYDEEEEEE